MKGHSFVICSAVVFLACACGKSGDELDGPIAIVSSRLIDTYKKMTDLNFNFNASTLSLSLSDEGNQWLSVAETEALTAKYDDTHFNQLLAHGTYASYANEFSGILVTSDTEFNGIAPGDNLGGKIRIVSVSPYKWLVSKGALTCDWSTVPADYKTVLVWGQSQYSEYLRPQNHPVNKVLTALTAEDLLLLNIDCVYLLFTETPSSKTHNLTVSFKEGDQTISASKTITFN